MTSNTSSNPPKHEPDCPYNYGHNCSCLPSSRPMTLRQQLAAMRDNDSSSDWQDFCDEFEAELERYGQEIAREARIAELKLLVNSVPRARMPESVDYVIQDRIKGLSRLTQKPPQPLADMQSDTSPKADSNQVDNLSPRKEQQ